MPDRPGLIASLATTARRILGPEPGAEVPRFDAAPTARQSAAQARRDGGGGGVGGGAAAVKMDCGPGGCGEAPWMDPQAGDPFARFRGGLDRATVDDVCVEMLMRTIVERIVDDANRERPLLSGEYVGEASGCIPWLAERGWFESDIMAQVYSRRYGGGAVLAFVDDGRDPALEVDLAAVRDVRGFVALSKWECQPADHGSTRMQAGWYGPRAGRPEHYLIQPDTRAHAAIARATGVEESSASADLRATLRPGQRWHRSRLVPRPYADKLDLRSARAFPNWYGWGPGAVDGCIVPYMLYREGALHTSAILRGSHVNVLQMPNVVHAQSTPAGEQAIRNAIGWVKSCLQMTVDAIPFLTIDNASKFTALSHNVAGVADLVAAQRRYLLDSLPEYVEVVLFGSSNGGLSGDSKEGEWRAYYGNVHAERIGRVWTAGAFGGGLRQACLYAMMCPDGPTGGQMDLTVAPDWPSLWQESAEVQAKARLSNAQARALDRVTLNLEPAAILRLDPALRVDFPELDVDELPFPTIHPGGGVQVDPATGAASPATPATTPAGALAAIAGQDNPAPEGTTDAASGVGETMPLFAGGDPSVVPGGAAPAGLPDDITTQNVLAKALMMTPKAFARWVADHPEVTPYPMPKGTRGGTRYRMSEVLAAFNASATKRADALRRG